MGLFQYIKDTRGELHHVAWPTRLQTIIYTALVIALSLVVALYLGFFDFIFTTGLSRVVQFLPERTPTAVEESIITPSESENVTNFTVETSPVSEDGAAE